MDQWIQDHAAEIRAWIEEHPYQTAFRIVGGSIMFAPGVFTGPVLAMLGFTATGPAAASFASALQSVLGVVPANSVFAILQSAGMGGYGVAVVNGISQAGAALASIWGAVNGRGRA